MRCCRVRRAKEQVGRARRAWSAPSLAFTAAVALAGLLAPAAAKAGDGAPAPQNPAPQNPAPQSPATEPAAQGDAAAPHEGSARPAEPAQTTATPFESPSQDNRGVMVHRTRIFESAARVKPELDPEAAALAQRVDAIVYEAVQDLGLSVEVSQRISDSDDQTEDALLKSGKEAWLIAPRLERRHNRWLLKILAAPPGSRVLYESVEALNADDLEKRIVLMMRDLVAASRPLESTASPVAAAKGMAETAVPARSPGRAVLSLNAALLGGYVGYSLQRASGSADERLTYPLAALGAGVGLGSALLVSEEWDIGVGDAWLLSAGMWWPTFSASFIARSYATSRSDRYAYGLLGTTVGVTLGTVALGFGHVSEGGALMTHSGGAFGVLLGALVDLSVKGRTDRTPWGGLGYGAGVGVLAGGVLATQLKMPAGRVLMIDLGASLGALTGAAAASPLLLVDESAANGHARNRLWLASIGAGTLVGGAIGYWTTRPGAAGAPTLSRLPAIPSLGIVAVTPEGPAYGASVQGTW